MMKSCYLNVNKSARLNMYQARTHSVFGNQSCPEASGEAQRDPLRATIHR